MSWAAILFFVLAISVAAGAYLFATVLFKGNASFHNSPLFEVYRAETFEVRLKHLDRAIYAGLLDLGASVNDIKFQSVSRKRTKNIEWDFAVLEIRPFKYPSKAAIAATFNQYLSTAASGVTFQITSKSHYPVIIRISLDGHPTHRLLFSKKLKKTPLLPLHKKPPKIALIIDDLGYDRRLALDFLSLDAPITVSIFPFSPCKEKIASLAHKKGLDVMLHLPMEPLEYPEIDPGKGALLTSMDIDTLRAQLEENLKGIPYVVGVNNHMGSKFTEDPAQMKYVFTLLKTKGLFFVDSRTTTSTCAKDIAKLLNVRFAERHVFLDHLEEESFIRGQIKRLIGVARSRGSAIGIAHPHKLTYQILKAELSNLKKEVEIVPVSRLVN